MDQLKPKQYFNVGTLDKSLATLCLILLWGIPTLREDCPPPFQRNWRIPLPFKFYPGKDLQMNYEEDLLVGYKWYQRQNIATLFPFGYGLSYTSFEYFNLDISEIDDCTYRCTFSIKNTGKVDGSEVAPVLCWLR